MATNSQVEIYLSNNIRMVKLREILRLDFGIRKYRITNDGDVHVYGTMPNSQETGWYLKGSLQRVLFEYQL